MYSVILAAMLSGAGQQTQGWHRTGCYGCTGGACVGSYGCTGCYGCSGCQGGHGHGRLFGGHGHGHCNGCIGNSNYGCNGFTGYTVGYSYWASGCYGSSCFGGCYGTGGIGCAGWTGGFATAPAYSGLAAFAEAEHIPGVNYSAPSYIAPAVGTTAPATSSPPAPAPVAPPPAAPPAAVAPVAPPAPLPPNPALDKAPAIMPAIPPAAPKGGLPDAPKLPDVPKLLGLPENPVSHETPVIPASTSTTARVIVHLPVDAKLWVDQVLCPLPGETRAFNTPTLVAGAQYAYTLTIETADGARSNRRVTMSAGRTVEVDFRGTGVETVQR